MRLQVHATLRQIAGGRHVELDLPHGGTIGALLDAVFGRFPAMRPELVDGDGVLHPHVHVFVNGRDVHYLEGGLDAVLPPDAKVDLFPAVGGG